MKTLFTLLFFLFILLSGVSAQEYVSSIGAKAGSGIVASYKLNAGGPGYLELVGGYDFMDKELFLTGYFEKHRSIANSNVYWYHGPGAGLIFEPENTAITVGWIIGLDLGLDNVPLNFSLDVSPSIVINGNDNFQPYYNGAIRYILNR